MDISLLYFALMSKRAIVAVESTLRHYLSVADVVPARLWTVTYLVRENLFNGLLGTYILVTKEGQSAMPRLDTVEHGKVRKFGTAEVFRPEQTP